MPSSGPVNPAPSVPSEALGCALLGDHRDFRSSDSLRVAYCDGQEPSPREQVLATCMSIGSWGSLRMSGIKELLVPVEYSIASLCYIVGSCRSPQIMLYI